jgi:hypothetical protein
MPGHLEPIASSQLVFATSAADPAALSVAAPATGRPCAAGRSVWDGCCCAPLGFGLDRCREAATVCSQRRETSAHQRCPAPSLNRPGISGGSALPLVV